jgi:hypothetical protein
MTERTGHYDIGPGLGLRWILLRAKHALVAGVFSCRLLAGRLGGGQDQLGHLLRMGNQ